MIWDGSRLREGPKSGRPATKPVLQLTHRENCLLARRHQQRLENPMGLRFVYRTNHRPKNLPAEYNGYCMPPYGWQIRLYRLFGRQAPDRWIECPPARK